MSEIIRKRDYFFLSKRMILCSACLLGAKCRHDGKSKPNKKALALAKSERLIPVCPDILGGLPVPREPTELAGKKVITRSGVDVTRQCALGAQRVLAIAKAKKINKAILKQRAPSCGNGKVYDGTFSGRIVKGWGLTADLLQKNGIEVISEEDL